MLSWVANWMAIHNYTIYIYIYVYVHIYIYISIKSAEPDRLYKSFTMKVLSCETAPEQRSRCSNQTTRLPIALRIFVNTRTSRETRCGPVLMEVTTNRVVFRAQRLFMKQMCMLLHTFIYYNMSCEITTSMPFSQMY